MSAIDTLEKQWMILGQAMRGLGYVVTRGGVLALGAGIAALSYDAGLYAGSDIGFQDACRIITVGDVACQRAEQLGKEIRTLKMTLPSTTRDPDKIAELCSKVAAGFPPGVAEHYGCGE